MNGFPTNAARVASGVVIYDNAPGTLNGTLGDGFTPDLPVTSLKQSDGQQLAATAGLVLRLKTETFRGLATTHNVIAESRDGDPNNVVIAAPETNADAIAAVMLRFGMNTSAINGVEGRGDFKPEPLENLEPSRSDSPRRARDARGKQAPPPSANRDQTIRPGVAIGSRIRY